MTNLSASIWTDGLGRAADRIAFSVFAVKILVLGRARPSTVGWCRTKVLRISSRKMVSKERRIEPRSALQGTVWVHNIESETVLCAKLVNVCPNGVGIASEHAIPPRSYVLFRATNGKIHGAASIRYCSWWKGRYRVGLELTGGTRVTPQLRQPASAADVPTRDESV